MKKIYIAGKISGMENGAFANFYKAKLELFLNGYDFNSIINPMMLAHNHDKKWKSYMKECLRELKDCDEIYMLNNWKKSKGAIIEWCYAVLTCKKITYQR